MLLDTVVYDCSESYICFICRLCYIYMVGVVGIVQEF